MEFDFDEDIPLDGYSVDDQNINVQLRAAEEDSHKHKGAGASAQQGNENNIGQIKPKKKRKSTKKLDVELMLSEKGLPYLRNKGSRLKYLGKGQEAKDLRTFMQFYQVWAHQLYPRVKFEDFIHMAEKTCRTKRIKITVVEWRNEWKNGAKTEFDNILSGITLEDEETLMTREKSSIHKDHELLGNNQGSLQTELSAKDLEYIEAGELAATEVLARGKTEKGIGGMVLEPYGKENVDPIAEYLDDFDLD